MWYCNRCDKSINIKIKQKHNESKSHKQKEESSFPKENVFIRPNINKIDSKNDNCARDYQNRYFHTFKIESIYDIKTTHGDLS